MSRGAVYGTSRFGRYGVCRGCEEERRRGALSPICRACEEEAEAIAEARR